MRRTIPILRGLAILGVIFNHANWHVLARFSAGEPAGYVYVALDQVGKFAIPAFMFIAGYFIAYATSGGKRNLRWSIIYARLENLLWPWLIWSAIMTLGQSFQGQPLSLSEFLYNLFVQYYFIPLLIFYYLLAPLIVKWARNQRRALLVSAAAIQLLAMGLFYLRVYHTSFPGALHAWIDLGPVQYLRFAFYFPFGIVCGMFPRDVKDTLAQYKSALPWLALAAFGLSVAETMIAYHNGGAVWPAGGDQTKLSSVLFSSALILCFIVYERLQVPYNRTITMLGTHSYGLYLTHYVVLGGLVEVIDRFTPGLSARGWLFQPLLFILTVTLSIILMQAVSRLPTKRLYRYAFG